MKSLYCISFICLFIGLNGGMASLAYDPSSIHPYITLLCAYQKGIFDQLLIVMARITQYDKWQPVVNLTSLSNIIGHPPTISFLMQSTMNVSATALALKAATQISEAYGQIVWIEPTAHSQRLRITCQYLTEFVENFVFLTEKKIGIITGVSQWKKITGDQFKCQQFGNYPLIYHDTKPFEPFGGWDKPILNMGYADTYFNCPKDSQYGFWYAKVFRMNLQN